jgi:hypothetical protein
MLCADYGRRGAFVCRACCPNLFRAMAVQRHLEAAADGERTLRALRAARCLGLAELSYALTALVPTAGYGESDSNNS